MTQSVAHKPITLFTPYFAARTPERQAELDLCLERNLACDAIDRVVLLVDDGHRPPFAHARLVIRDVAERPTYRQWVQLSQQDSGTGIISVLANSDIYFDETLALARTCLAGPERFIALSRYDKVGDTLVAHANPKWSQDVWAFDAGAVLPPSLLKALDIPLGVPRCDNKIAYVFAVHGWELFNPMPQVRSVHVHETQQRNYNKKTDLTVIGAVAYVHPTTTIDTPSNVEIDVWARRSQAITRVNLNRSLDLWDAAPTAEAAANSAEMAPRAPAAAALAARFAAATPRLRLPAVPRPLLPSGDTVFKDTLGRFSVVRHAGGHTAIDRLTPDAALLMSGPDGELSPQSLLAAFVPPVLNTAPIVVQDRPAAADDCNFWQYPAGTERQAWRNHQSLAEGSNIDSATRTVHTYLALPWATYIDRKSLPPHVVALMAPRVRGLHRLAAELGHTLAVHTVCQQIHWRRMIDTFVKLGVTDLHISHALKDLEPAQEGWPLRIHSWPLIAPNVEDPARSIGLIYSKPVQDKRYLASFIGAHMPHYRSQVRLHLREAALASKRNDVIVDLGNEWHFNKIVYQEQVQQRELTITDQDKTLQAARRYNEVLSDSVFSLCPEGAGPNTLRVWESMAVGAIPVIIADDWKPPARPGWDLRSAGLFVNPKDIGSLFEVLARIPTAEIERRQYRCVAMYQRMRDLKAFGDSG